MSAPRHQWRTIGADLQRCRRCDLIRRTVKAKVWEVREPGGQWGTAIGSVPACSWPGEPDHPPACRRVTAVVEWARR